MHFLLDHIAAILIFTTVAFTVAVSQIRAKDDMMEQTIAYASKKQTLELADMLEQELALIGEGTLPSKQIDTVTNNAAGETTNFVFWRNDGVADLEIEYQLVFVDSVSIRNQMAARYRLDRYENSVLLGGSTPTIRHFRLDPLNNNGTIVNPAAARLVRVRIANMYPMGDLDDMYIGETYWGITIQPMNLN